MEQSKIEDLALAIQRAFESKQQTRLGFYRSSPRTHKDFLKAAEICAELQADPVVYVEAHFKNAKDVFPQFLHSINSRQKYQSYLDASYIPPEEMLETYKEYVAEQFMRLGRELEMILLDDNLSIPAWFRVIASKTELPSVMKKYITTASAYMQKTAGLREYLTEKGFDTKRYDK